MKRHPILFATAVLLLMGIPFLAAHPHFNKSLTVKLPGGADATVTYNTIPSNEIHATNAATGAFVTPRQPRLKLSADVKVGDMTLTAGEYVIGVIKNSASDWSMALYSGTLARGATPDPAKLIKLDSMYSTGHGKAEHMLLDISPGGGKFQGKAVLAIHFGTMYLAAPLS